MRRRKTKVDTSGFALYYNLLQLTLNMAILVMTGTAIAASSKYVLELNLFFGVLPD